MERECKQDVTNKKEENRKDKNKKILKRFLIIFLIAIVSFLISYLFPLFKMTNNSMSNTLSTREYFLSLRGNEIERGDIVSFPYGDEFLVERVIGLPNEVVNIDKDGDIFINGEHLNESYLKNKSLKPYDVSFPYKIPEGYVFVMGDNRENSSDSRISKLGEINIDEIISKIFFRIYPLNKWGFID